MNATRLRVIGLAALVAISHAWVLPGAADAVPEAGSLDLGFGEDGKVITPVGDGDQGWAMALQPDGRIVVAGFSEQGTTGRDFVVLRYEPDGTLDEGFGGGGIVTTDVGTGPNGGRAIAVQADGRILVAVQHRRTRRRCSPVRW